MTSMSGASKEDFRNYCHETKVPPTRKKIGGRGQILKINPISRHLDVIYGTEFPTNPQSRQEHALREAGNNVFIIVDV